MSILDLTCKRGFCLAFLFDFIEIVSYNIKGENMKFIWDEDKNKINKIKHRISFEEASLIYDDENYIEIYDKKHIIDEDIYKVIGRVGKVLFVIVTYREKDTIRIISARLATPDERREYEWQWL